MPDGLAGQVERPHDLHREPERAPVPVALGGRQVARLRERHDRAIHRGGGVRGLCGRHARPRRLRVRSERAPTARRRSPRPTCARRQWRDRRHMSHTPQPTGATGDSGLSREIRVCELSARLRRFRAGPLADAPTVMCHASFPPLLCACLLALIATVTVGATARSAVEARPLLRHGAGLEGPRHRQEDQAHAPGGRAARGPARQPLPPPARAAPAEARPRPALSRLARAA